MKRFLIVGQGIAGSVLGWVLHEMGAEIEVMDAGFGDSASQVAAGIINPVTGKRYVKTWLLDQLLPVARHFYGGFEEKMGIQVWHDRSILRLLNSTVEENDWAARCALPEYAAYIGERTDAGIWEELIKTGFRYGTLKSAAQVDFAMIIKAFRNWAVENGRYLTSAFDFNQTEIYQKKYDCIVFCEGYRAKDNPFFAYLPWQVTKGEALIIKFETPPDSNITEMLKKTMQITPWKDNTFWAGATNQWDFEDANPTDSNKELIVKELNQILDIPYTIEAHKAAIRPTVKDRRPFIGKHPLNPQLAIFNGLGTKGALLAPFWAQHLAEHLLLDSPLDGSVDINRFLH